MKKILVIGATGFVGKEITLELINRGYKVSALARNETKLKKAFTPTENLTVIASDIADTDTLVELIKENDIVISAFNAGWNNPNLYNDTKSGLAAIDKAISLANPFKFIIIGGAGSLKINGEYIVDGADFPAPIKPGALALKEYLVDLESNKRAYNWGFFSPAIEMSPFSEDKVRKGVYRLGSNTPVFDTENRSRISVQDVAVAIADEVENNKFSKEQFTAAY